MTDTAAAADPHLELHRRLLLRSVELSREHMLAGAGGPFGSVVAAPDGRIVAEGWNQVTSTNDPTAHAEVVAIRRACAALGTFSLQGHILYASCEPCPMCLASAYWARVDAIWYANSQADAAAIDFDDSMIYREVALPPAQRSLPIRRLLLPEALAVFREWAEKVDRIAY